MIKHYFACLLIVLMTSSNAFAQMLRLVSKRPQPQIMWGEDGSLALIEQAGTALKMGNPKTGNFQQIHLPSGTLGVSVFESQISCARFEDGKFLLSRFGAGDAARTFIIDAEMGTDSRGFPMALYETKEPGLYLGINVDTGFVKSGEASCCAWWREAGDGRFVMESIISIGLDHPLYLPVRKDGQSLYAQSHLSYGGMFPILDYPIRVSGAFIVVSWSAGKMWVIRDGDLFPMRTIELASLKPDQIAGKVQFPAVMLGVQPMPNGHLLVAKRDASTLNQNRSMDRPKPSDQSMSPSEECTRIEWVDVDPMIGTLRPAKPERDLPSDLPVMLNSKRDVDMFRFGLNLKGQVVIPWVSPPIDAQETKPTQTSKTSR